MKKIILSLRGGHEINSFLASRIETVAQKIIPKMEGPLLICHTNDELGEKAHETGLEVLNKAQHSGIGKWPVPEGYLSTTSLQTMINTIEATGNGYTTLWIICKSNEIGAFQHAAAQMAGMKKDQILPKQGEIAVYEIQSPL